jgi:hypothetical protein
MLISIAIMENSVEISQKTKHLTTILSINPITKYISKENEIGMSKRCMSAFSSSMQHRLRMLRKGINLSVYWWMNKENVDIHIGIPFSF